MSDRIDALCKGFIGCFEIVHPGMRLAKQSIAWTVAAGDSTREALARGGARPPAAHGRTSRAHRNAGGRRGESDANDP